MRILILGADGFIGREVSKYLKADNEVFRAVRNPVANEHEVSVDLLDKKTITEVLLTIKPQTIINCAGVVDNSEKAKMNIEFTKNLLDAVVETGVELKSIVICGSAAEYGKVENSNVPIKEKASLSADTEYGLSKLQEEKLAFEYKNRYNLPIIVLRIFNPIGAGMHDRMIIPGIVRQAEANKAGKAEVIEVSRLDSKRDYINVKDVARAIKAVALGQGQYDIYNVGSGMSTSNQQLIDIVLKHYKLPKSPKLVEASNKPEPPLAIRANIDRIVADFDWKPEYTIEESIREIFDDTGKS